jgi:hypothetical protein
VRVEHFRCAVEPLQPFFHFHRVGRSAAEEALHRSLVEEDRACRVAGGRFPELPARDIGAAALVRGQQAALGLLRREVLDDGVRLPEFEIALLERRHALVGIDRRIGGGLLVTLG